MLASHCPGWICYAEKRFPECLPYISTTKSPQQIMGSAIKNVICKANGVSHESIYHVTVMPCYDKKLEASRSDFQYHDEASGRTINEVDLVLTTSEIDELLLQSSELQSNDQNLEKNKFLSGDFSSCHSSSVTHTQSVATSSSLLHTSPTESMRSVTHPHKRVKMTECASNESGTGMRCIWTRVCAHLAFDFYYTI